MDRTECEKLIYEKVEEIREIYRQYNPTGEYLSIQINDDENENYTQFNNRQWKDGEDENKPIDYSRFDKREVNEND